MDLFKEFLKGIWASLDVKKILVGFYYNNLKPELLKLVDKTENPWDNYAVTAVDFLVEKFFGSAEKAEEAKKSLAQ